MSNQKLDQQSISSPQILILSNFDGTMTGLDRENTIDRMFYKQLFKDVNSLAYFRNWKFKNSEEIQLLFKRKFGEYKQYLADPKAWEVDKNKPDFDLLMPPKIVRFYKNQLNARNSKLIIITRNRETYVKEVLRYHGFTEDELKKITIQDVGHNADAKKICAARILSETWPDTQMRTKWVCVYDDSEKDRKSMVEAVTQRADLNLIAPVFNKGELNAEECEAEIRKNTQPFSSQPIESQDTINTDTSSFNKPDSTSSANVHNRQSNVPDSSALAEIVNIMKQNVSGVDSLGQTLGRVQVLSKQPTKSGKNLNNSLLTYPDRKNELPKNSTFMNTESSSLSNKLDSTSSNALHGVHLNKNDQLKIMKLIQALGTERDSFFSMNKKRKENKILALTALMTKDTGTGKYESLSELAKAILNEFPDANKGIFSNRVGNLLTKFTQEKHVDDQEENSWCFF